MPDEHAAHAPPGAAELPYGMVELTGAECRALLERQRLCVVSVVDGEEPYAVPVFYGFDGETIYLGMMEGRKTRALDANPRVCVVVTEVAVDDTWRSVMIRGVVRVLTDPSERESAARVLMTHNRRVRSAPPSGGDPPRRRHSGGRILRVEQVRISGREKR